jgi:hypothetical protein
MAHMGTPISRLALLENIAHMVKRGLCGRYDYQGHLT